MMKKIFLIYIILLSFGCRHTDNKTVNIYYFKSLMTTPIQVNCKTIFGYYGLRKININNKGVFLSLQKIISSLKIAKEQKDIDVRYKIVCSKDTLCLDIFGKIIHNGIRMNDSPETLDYVKNLIKKYKNKSLKRKGEFEIPETIDVNNNVKLLQIKENFGSKICNIKYLTELDKNLNNATNENIKNFLLTFDKSCSSNVEYSEYSNELLFKVLFHYPKKTIQIIDNNAEIKTNLIVNQLNSPVNDLINIDSLIVKLKKQNNKLALKFIKELKKAKSKSVSIK